MMMNEGRDEWTVQPLSSHITTNRRKRESHEVAHN